MGPDILDDSVGGVVIDLAYLVKQSQGNGGKYGKSLEMILAQCAFQYV